VAELIENQKAPAGNPSIMYAKATQRNNHWLADATTVRSYA